MPQVPTSLFEFWPTRRNNQDTPMNQDTPLSQDTPMAIVDGGSVRKEKNARNLDPGSATLAVATVHYVPRPLGHEPQRAPVFMHPLAAERPISAPKPMDVDGQAASTAPSVPKPMDIGALHTQVDQLPSLGMPQTPVSTAGPASAIPHPSPIVTQPISVPNPALVLEQKAHVPAGVLDAQPPVPASPSGQPFPRSLSHLPLDHRPTIQSSRKRLADNISRGTGIATGVRQDTRMHGPRADAKEAPNEKTRLVEQLDLTTRKIIEQKDEKIAELQAQVSAYQAKMDNFAARMEELEKKLTDDVQNLGGPRNQVVLAPITSSSDDGLRREGQDVRMASGIGEREEYDKANIGGPPNQVALVSVISSSGSELQREEQDIRMASGTEEGAAQGEANLGSPSNQVALASVISSSSSELPRVEQDVHMASETKERVAPEEARTSSGGQPSSSVPSSNNQAGTPSNNTNNHFELAQAPQRFEGEDVNMAEQTSDRGRREEVRRGKHREKPLDEDEEEEMEKIDEDDAGEDDAGDYDGDDDEQQPGEEMRGNSQPSVPKPILQFRRPRGGAGPRLQIDPQTPYTANPALNPVSNTTNNLSSSLPPNMTAEQVAAIAQIVMTVQNQNTPKPVTPPKKKKRNVSGTIMEQAERGSDPRRNALVAAVRKHMNSLLKIKCDRDIQWHLSPAREVVDAFAEGQEQGPGPTLFPMQLFFADKKMKHAWNIEIAERFFEDFLQRGGTKLEIQEKEWPDISDIFWQRFANLKKEWKNWQAKEGEDSKAVVHRNFERLRKTHKVTRRDGRRQHLKELRVGITEGNKIKADGTQDDVWYFLWLVATKLGLGGMSSDESSNEGAGSTRKCVIKSVPWRNEELIPYLQMIDRDFNRYNRYGNHKPGNPFRDRIRLPGAKASTRGAIRGLPMNFYDKTWYANLSSGDKAFLQAGPELPFPVIVAYN